MSLQFSMAVFFCCTIILSMAHCFYSEMWTNDDGDSGPLSRSCMRCICEETGCRRSEMPRSGSSIGPFEITYGYWLYAFDLTEEDLQDGMKEFRECTTNTWCSARTVQHFNKRKLPACMTHKKKTQGPCELALMLHLTGNCDGELDPAAKQRLHSCLDRQLWQWLGH